MSLIFWLLFGIQYHLLTNAEKDSEIDCLLGAEDCVEFAQSLEKAITELKSRQTKINFRTASLKEIAETPSKETEYFQLTHNPKVYVIDFSSLEEQGYTMNRMALLLETSIGSQEYVVNDNEMYMLIAQTGENMATFNLGHDFRMSAIAEFFNLAAKQKIQLNLYELKLKNLLLENKLLLVNDAHYVAADKTALITASKLQNDNPGTPQDESIVMDTRQIILQHELSHGEYFTNDDYYQYCHDFWNTLTDAQKESIRAYLENKYYDKEREDLMINEFQAYLAYTGIEFGDFFIDGEVKGISGQQIMEFRKRFINGSVSTLPIFYQ
jgi:hypothetical protein